MRTEVAVVGRGPAGVAAALSLHRAGARVTVIDRSLPSPVLGESLPPRARPILTELGLSGHMSGEIAVPIYGARSTWGSATPLESHSLHGAYGHGWRLHRPGFDVALARALDGAGIVTVARARVVGIERGRESRWTLKLVIEGERTEMSADYLVDASGRSRAVVRRLGVAQLGYDHLIARVALLAPPHGSQDLDSFTEIEATPGGWWYVGVLPDGRLAAGYMTDRDTRSATVARTVDGWPALLEGTERLGKRIAMYGYTLHRPIRTYLARSTRLQQAAGDGWCAVGDAAATRDPLSSAGIMNALETGRRATEALDGADRGGPAKYDEWLAEDYARYLAHWLAYYALESRWPQEEFWSRRHRKIRDVLAP